MVNINLLPWREAQREELRRQFLSVLGGVLVLGLLVGFSADRVVSTMIADQTNRNKFIETGIRDLEKKVAEISELKKRKMDMLDRMEVIKNLQNSRPEVVRLFDEFVRVLPDGSFITNTTVRGTRLSVEGKAESNNRISSYMRNLEASYKFDNPNLTRVTADRQLGEQGSRFNMGVQIVPKTLEQQDAAK